MTFFKLFPFFDSNNNLGVKMEIVGDKCTFLTAT